MDEFEYDYPDEDLFAHDGDEPVADSGPVGRAQSADGHIRVVLGSDGGVQELFLDPTVLSRGADVESSELAEQIKLAINEAFTDLAEQHAAAAAADLDTGGADEKVTEFRQAMAAMRADVERVEGRLAVR